MTTRTIWKYTFELKDGPQTHDVPRGAGSLMVAMQDGKLCLWMEVDANRPRDPWHFTVFGTGHPIPEIALHLGSCLDGPFVWHLYEVKA